MAVVPVSAIQAADLELQMVQNLQMFDQSDIIQAQPVDVAGCIQAPPGNLVVINRPSA